MGEWSSGGRGGRGRGSLKLNRGFVGEWSLGGGRGRGSLKSNGSFVGEWSLRGRGRERKGVSKVK